MTDEIDLINTSKLFFRCERLWDAMYEAAQPERSPELFGDDEPRMVFTGHVVPLAATVGEKPSYVGQLTRRLRMMGSVQQLVRGGGRGIGRWYLVEKPTLEIFESSKEVVPSTIKSAWQRNIEQQLRDVCERLDALEGRS